MYLFLGILMLLIIGGFILLITGAAEVEKLRAQNRYLVEQIARMRQEQTDLIKSLQSQAPLAGAAPAPVAAIPAAVAAGAEPERVSALPEVAPAVVDEGALKKMRSNARSLQTLVEGFALDHDGTYPANLRELEANAVASSANVTVTNPFNGVSGFITHSDLTLDISETAVDEGMAEHAGKLLFQANVQDGQVIGYMIAALDGQGFLLKESDGQPFTLGT